MTKTKAKVVLPTEAETEALLITYKQLCEEADELKEKMDKIKTQIFEHCDLHPEWFEEGHRKHFGKHGYVDQKLISKVLLPENMQNANDPELIKFCRKYPRAVKFELVKSQLNTIDLDAWGIVLDQKRMKTIDW
jgi:hypothetical protein